MRFEFEDGAIIEAVDVCEASFKYHSERLSSGSLCEHEENRAIAKCDWGIYEMHSILTWCCELECKKNREYYGWPL